MYTIAFTPLQYRSHILRNRGCPPISHIFKVTLPLVTLRILNPTVGIISSANCPVYDCEIYFFLTARTFTSVVLPLFCSPTSVTSISSLKNRLLSQSIIDQNHSSIVLQVRIAPLLEASKQ